MTFVALLSMTAGAWAQTENEVTVTPVTGQTNQWTFTMPDAEVELQVNYVPSYYVTFNTVYLDVDATDTGVEYGFSWSYSGKGYADDGDRVRPVLAF